MKEQIMLKNDLLLRAARRERTERTPVWLMRQAGRSDPQYLALRNGDSRPLEAIFRDPVLAARISLLPRRFGVDAIIIFQDILTPLAPMGAEFVFQPGPVLAKPVRTPEDVDALRPVDPSAELGFVAKTIRIVQTTLDGSLPVIGFAGAPLTLAFFLIEGKSPGQNPERTRAFMRDDPEGFHRLLGKLTDMTVDYLAMQIDAGADAVQLFESLANLASRSEYEEYAHRYHTEIFSRLAGRVPTLLFVKDRPFVDLMAASGADVVSVGTDVDLTQARRQFGDRVAFQGNLDNQLVAHGSLDEIDEAVRRCVEAGGRQGHILNLNHGVLPDTPFENVLRVVSATREASTGSNGARGGAK
jgi:uroporphyrinogen decarboxylase